MPAESPQTYRNQLSPEDFVFAVSATEEEFKERKEEMRSKGVERLTGLALQQRYTDIQTGEEADTQTKLYTCINETEIGAGKGTSITVENIRGGVPTLVLRRSLLPDVIIKNCALVDGANAPNSVSFLVRESITGDFFIERSIIGNFSIRQTETARFFIWQSTTGYFLIDQSKTGFFSVRESTTDYFTIRQQSVTGKFVINQSKTGKISINKSTIGKFSIEQSTVEGFAVRNQINTGEFDIINSEIGNFTGDNLYSSFHLMKATIAQFRLSNCRLTELKIEPGCKIECYIAKSAINLLDLRHLTLPKESVISFVECAMYACLMEEFTVLGNLFFLRVKNLASPFVEEVPDETREKQSNVPVATFRIARSSLGKTEFTECDLTEFRFEFNNAKLMESFISGGTVPEKNVVIYEVEEGTLQWQEQNVFFYNQIRKIFEGQGDIYWATYFQAKTASYQEEVLKLRRLGERRKQIPEPYFNTTFWDLLTLKLNRWSNLHGESWGRALAFILVAPLPVYVLFLWAGGRLFLNTGIDWNLAGAYFTFLDPTHKIDFLKVKLTGWSSLVDFLGRIIAGYGIYQFISAFRRHSRK
ncbi:hypothetical protein [Spirosoma areae]